MQADIFRPLRLPALLVGDGRLGGISTTLAAYEMLVHRGFDVAAIALTESRNGPNTPALIDHFKNDVSGSTPIIRLPLCRPPSRFSAPLFCQILFPLSSKSFAVSTLLCPSQEARAMTHRIVKHTNLWTFAWHFNSSIRMIVRRVNFDTELSRDWHQQIVSDGMWPWINNVG